jgi:hypothetical protein
VASSMCTSGRARTTMWRCAKRASFRLEGGESLSLFVCFSFRLFVCFSFRVAASLSRVFWAAAWFRLSPRWAGRMCAHPLTLHPSPRGRVAQPRWKGVEKEPSLLLARVVSLFASPSSALHMSQSLRAGVSPFVLAALGATGNGGNIGAASFTLSS